MQRVSQQRTCADVSVFVYVYLMYTHVLGNVEDNIETISFIEMS